MEEKAIEFREKLVALCEEYGMIILQDDLGYSIETINEDDMLDLKSASIEVDEE